jgi:putative Holliday junction resolvase
VSTSEFDSFIDDYSKKEEIEAFVIGYPVRLNNVTSDVVKHIDPFIKKLKKKFPGKPVHLADERFTSRMAFQAMIEGGVKKMDRRDKSMIDKISASIILQSFLDNKRK